MTLQLLFPSIILCVPIILTRWYVAWRIALSYALTGTLLWRFSPPVHWSDEDWGYPIGVAIIGINVLFVIACFSFRALWVFGTRRIDLGRDVNTAVPDLVLTVAIASLLTLILFIELSRATAGSDTPFIVHSALILAAIALAVYAQKRMTGLARRFILSVSAALILMTLSSAIYYPAAVLSAAREAANGAPHCIALHLRKRMARSYGDLTFLSFDKHKELRHASLHVLIDGHIQIFNYSYYRTRFLPHPGWPPPIPCVPSKNPLGS